MIRLSVTVKGNKKIGLYVFEYNLIFFLITGQSKKKLFYSIIVKIKITFIGFEPVVVSSARIKLLAAVPEMEGRRFV